MIFFQRFYIRKENVDLSIASLTETISDITKATHKLSLGNKGINQAELIIFPGPINTIPFPH